MKKKKETELINRGLSIEDLDHIRDEEEEKTEKISPDDARKGGGRCVDFSVS